MTAASYQWISARLHLSYCSFVLSHQCITTLKKNPTKTVLFNVYLRSLFQNIYNVYFCRRHAVIDSIPTCSTLYLHCGALIGFGMSWAATLHPCYLLWQISGALSLSGICSNLGHGVTQIRRLGFLYYQIAHHSHGIHHQWLLSAVITLPQDLDPKGPYISDWGRGGK